MSGHSKWANIKHTKEKADAKRGKIFTKIGKEIMVAAKIGGADPTTNSKLRDIIAKARANNMPNDNITRNIKKAAGDMNSASFEEIMYEGYGVGGSAVLVQCLTDNKNRTAGDVRHIFDKFGGSMGSTGCVGFLFERKGVLVIEKTDKINEEQLFEWALDANAEDMQTEEDVYEIYTSVENFENVKNSLQDKGLTFMEAQVEPISNALVELDDEKFETFSKMIDAFEDNDDVQEVYHNVK